MSEALKYYSRNGVIIPQGVILFTIATFPISSICSFEVAGTLWGKCCAYLGRRFLFFYRVGIYDEPKGTYTKYCLYIRVAHISYDRRVFEIILHAEAFSRNVAAPRKRCCTFLKSLPALA